MARATKKQSDFVIEKNIPIQRGREKYPFLKMEIGDSFVFSGNRKVIGAAASWYGSRYKMKFTTRSVDGGVRVWRVK